MTTDYTDIIQQAYIAFNQRDIDGVLALMNTDVHWPNGWEGGYVEGYDEIRDYWTRQWKEINPIVTPVSFTGIPNDKVDVEVHQLVKDHDGNILADVLIHHIYTFENGKIKSMEIEK